MQQTRKIEISIDENGCFNCISHAPTKDGYRKIKVNKKLYIMHRFIYEQCFGEFDLNLVIRHKCDNRNCINPEHLETGTIQDNNLDTIKRNRLRAPKGEQKGTAKLKNQQVLEIIKSDLSLGELSNKYGVTKSTVSKIKKRQLWKHLNVQEM